MNLFLSINNYKFQLKSKKESVEIKRTEIKEGILHFEDVGAEKFTFIF